MRHPAPAYSLVIPTVGRPTLAALLERVAAATGPQPLEVLVVDDRRAGRAPLDTGALAALDGRVRVLPGGGRGPAAARNTGWRAARGEWVAFLDDDVLPDPDWCERLAEDLTGLPERVAGSQGRVVVPLPTDRRPTDWERATAGLEGARWATADMAYRRHVLAHLGGFDERFPRAYREDSDLALRALAAGYELVQGSRRTTHLVRPAGWWVSVRVQAGNADNALMRRLHGPGWRARAGEGRGRLGRHAATVAGGLAALLCLAAGGGSGAARRGWARPAAAAAGLAWLAGTAELAAARIAPGPRTPAEVLRMLVTSVAIPPAAVWYRLRGELAHRRAAPLPPPAAGRAPARSARQAWGGGR